MECKKFIKHRQSDLELIIMCCRRLIYQESYQEDFVSVTSALSWRQVTLIGVGVSHMRNYISNQVQRKCKRGEMGTVTKAKKIRRLATQLTDKITIRVYQLEEVNREYRWLFCWQDSLSIEGSQWSRALLSDCIGEDSCLPQYGEFILFQKIQTIYTGRLKVSIVGITVGYSCCTIVNWGEVVRQNPRISLSKI